MKKKFLLTIIATLMVTCGTFAQNKLVATLKHGDSTTIFYGGSALQQAHDLAEDGDLITLSSGVFSNTTLSKPIIIRGASCVRDSSEKMEATKIALLTIANNTSNLSFEGIDFLDIRYNKGATISDIHFDKCKITNLEGGDDASLSNWSFLHSIVIRIYINTSAKMYFTNSIIMFCEIGKESAVMNFYNCFIRISHPNNYRTGLPGGMAYNLFQNSIICNNNGWPEFPNTVTASNNVGINKVIFSYVADADSNVTLEGVEGYNIFKTYTGGDYTENETFELTDEAKAQYLGSDGTQVGIYGGDYPFNMNLSYPQFTKATVASKAENGKLSVNIELNGGN